MLQHFSAYPKRFLAVASPLPKQQQGASLSANEVFGGVAATSFGTVDTVLHIDQDFRHPHNFLRELWAGPSESQLFKQGSIRNVLMRLHDGIGQVITPCHFAIQ